MSTFRLNPKSFKVKDDITVIKKHESPIKVPEIKKIIKFDYSNIPAFTMPD
jgi:hypothetical protein